MKSPHTYIYVLYKAARIGISKLCKPIVWKHFIITYLTVNFLIKRGKFQEKLNTNIM